MQEVGLTTKLGAKIDPTLVFRAQGGEVVRLGDVLAQGLPVVLVPAYYNCPRLCGFVLEGVTTLLNQLTLTLGADYRVLTVSFDPKDNPEVATKRAATYIQQFKRPDLVPSNWQFLSGDAPNITPLMNQIGFHYKPDHDQFAHGAAIMILTPQGEISQYFTGVQYSPFDVRLALVEASKGKIGSPFDHIMLFCFRFDETKGRYTWAAYNLVRAGGLVTFLLLSGLLVGFWRKERAARATPP